MGVYTASTAEGYQIRISPEAFIIALALFLAIAFIFAVLRTVARLQQNRRLYLDDYFLFYAVVAAAACAGVVYSIKDQIYLQIYVGVGWQEPAADFSDIMLVFEKRIMVCSALIWSVIYAIKFSFLTFFRKLVDRVWKLEIYWWIVVAITAACGLTSIPLSFIICTNFSSDYMTYCPIPSQLANEHTFLHTTTALDILTDILIISIPILLLWDVQISWQRKLTLITMLCLSAFCIVIAIIRTSLADLPVNNVIDTSWLVFWQGIEAAIGVIIVSCTAFRGLFGGQGTFTRRRAAAKRANADNADNAEEGVLRAARTRPAGGSVSGQSEWTSTSLSMRENSKSDKYWYGFDRVDTEALREDDRMVLDEMASDQGRSSEELDVKSKEEVVIMERRHDIESGE